MIVEEKQKENMIIYEAENDDAGKELKKILKNKLDFSSRLLARVKRGKTIFVNGEYLKYHETINAGDEIKIVMEDEPNHFTLQDVPFEAVYEDVDLILVNKEPGIVTHPTKSHPDWTIANGAALYLKNKGIDCKVRFVNRLDMDTSGLLIIAKNAYAHHVLSEQMQEDRIEKKYIAFVWGVIKEDDGRIEAPIYRTTMDSIKRVVDERGQESITEFKVLERYKNATMVEVKLLTGRTHQIRVHMEHLGHPLIGDTLYGKEDAELIDRQALHAEYLRFWQPRFKRAVEVKADLPADLLSLRDKLKEM